MSEQNYFFIFGDPYRTFRELREEYFEGINSSESTTASDYNEPNPANPANQFQHNFFHNLYSIDYWQLDPQIQEIIARVCSTCFNNRRLLAHAVTAGITGLSIVISDELTHDYNIPNTTRHASSSASSSHEIFINHNNVNRPYINNIHVLN